MRTSLTSSPAIWSCIVLSIIVIVVESFSLQKQHHNAKQQGNEKLWSQSVDDDGGRGEKEMASLINRREWLATTTTSALIFQIAAATTTSPLLTPTPAVAADDEGSKTMSATWLALSGLESNDDKVVAFDEKAYKAMRDDKSRTPLFQKAIENRLDNAPGGPESMTVLDLGTGPYALFAIQAAQAGAGKVFAIEGNPFAAAVARQTIKKAGYDDVIEVLEGYSTDISLPDNQKADLIIAEIVGSIGTEEGAYATILDAHKRLAKSPNDPKSWIPNRIQTYGSPASYSLHNLFKPPAFDWTKIAGEPVRFNCRDRGLQVLSDPLLVEDISFAEIDKIGATNKQQLTFTVDGDRIDENNSDLMDEFYTRGRLPKKEAEQLAFETARSVTGIAFWPRLTLDEDTVVNSRSYPSGGYQRSHWQTVLPIMTGNSPIGDLKGGDKIVVTTEFETPASVTKPPMYHVDGKVLAS